MSGWCRCRLGELGTAEEGGKETLLVTAKTTVLPVAKYGCDIAANQSPGNWVSERKLACGAKDAIRRGHFGRRRRNDGPRS